MSIGRKPSTAGLGLENTRVQVNERGWIVADNTLKTNDENIYAIGDIVGEPMLAHKASHEGRVAVDAIAGGSLVLGVGREGEIYHGIGRGELNIAGLPVYRDAVGGVGTPTSDEERTKIGLDTTHLLMIINGYSGLEGLEAAGKYAVGLLSKYVSAINMEAELVTAKDRTKIAL
jgi:hypothetical protein